MQNIPKTTFRNGTLFKGLYLCFIFFHGWLFGLIVGIFPAHDTVSAGVPREEDGGSPPVIAPNRCIGAFDHKLTTK